MNAQAKCPYAPAPATSGTYLRVTLPDVDVATAERLLGKPGVDGYVDPDSGYEGIEWWVCRDGHVFELYARWGVLRIGSVAPAAEVDRFAMWLTSGGVTT